MKYLSILAHPDSKSLNSNIANTIKKHLVNTGNIVVFHDLYEEKEKIALLTEKIATVIITSDRDPEPMLIEKIWKKDILSYCGIDDAGVLTHFSTRTAGSKERDLFIKRIISRVSIKNKS